MKKIFWVFICVILLLDAPLALSAASVSVMVNGRALALDVAPILVNDRAMIPFRAIGDAIGAKVDWQAKDRTVWLFLNGAYVGVAIGSRTMTVGRLGGDIRHLALDVPAQILEGRTMVPLRAISEGLNCKVDWNGAANAINIQKENAAAESINTKDKLLRAIEKNVREMRTTFSIDTEHLSPDVIQMNICNYFPGVAKSDVHWWTYPIDDFPNAYITYELTYMMSANIRYAVQTGVYNRLTKNESAVLQEVRRVVGEVILPTMSDFEKEMTIHDYIVKNTRYDESENISDDSHSPFGALIRQVAVCNGYSEAFKIFMDFLEIPCEIVTGTAVADGTIVDHSWNRIQLDGEYYLVDVTWDDPTPDAGDIVRYDYLNLTDDLMNRVHTPIPSSDKISAASRYNYYVYHKLIVRSDQDAARIIQNAARTGQDFITFRGEGYDVTSMDLAGIMADVLGAGQRYHYSYDKILNTVNINL